MQGTLPADLHSHPDHTQPGAAGHTQDKWPGERLWTAVTLSRWFRCSHGLNTSFPSPSLLSFRHCSFSRSIRRYSPYSRPLSAGSCSPAQPQPCPCPCPWPCPDIVELKTPLFVTDSPEEWSCEPPLCLRELFYTVKWDQQVSIRWVKRTEHRLPRPVRDFQNKTSMSSNLNFIGQGDEIYKKKKNNNKISIYWSRIVIGFFPEAAALYLNS